MGKKGKKEKKAGWSSHFSLTVPPFSFRRGGRGEEKGKKKRRVPWISQNPSTQAKKGKGGKGRGKKKKKGRRGKE